MRGNSHSLIHVSNHVFLFSLSLKVYLKTTTWFSANEHRADTEQNTSFSPLAGEQITVMSSITGARRVTCWLNGHRCAVDWAAAAQKAALCPKPHSDWVELKVLTRYCSDWRCVAVLPPPGPSHSTCGESETIQAPSQASEAPAGRLNKSE